MNYLLDLYNRNWKEGIIPEGQRSTTNTALIKKGKEQNVLGTAGQKL